MTADWGIGADIWRVWSIAWNISVSPRYHSPKTVIVAHRIILWNCRDLNFNITFSAYVQIRFTFNSPLLITNTHYMSGPNGPSPSAQMSVQGNYYCRRFYYIFYSLPLNANYYKWRRPIKWNVLWIFSIMWRAVNTNGRCKWLGKAIIKMNFVIF